MPSKKPQNPLNVETKEYHVFDPENVKESVEIAVRPKPKTEDLETIEKTGKVKKKIKAKNNYDGVKGDKKDKPAKLKKDGYTLIITEKPQAAEKIAAALSDGGDKKITKNQVSYYELARNNKKIIVCCAVGHLFTVSQTVKGTGYPIFDINWFPNFEVKKKDFTKKYYVVIEKLVRGAGEFVVATDFDVEGEVIGYNIIRLIAKQKDAKRMKFSSLTAEEIQDSFDNLNNSIEWGQAIAGETRHFIDWMYGINLSRALMSSIKTTGKFKVMSIGRVQGPALKLIVDKELAIRNFKSSLYWQVYITINDGETELELKHNRDITKKSELDKFKELEGEKASAETKKTKQVIGPPSPFDLTSLQTEAYKFYSITPSVTLSIAQKLYLAGLISYPRTSSQKIPENVKPLEILKSLERNYLELVRQAVRKNPVEGNKSDPAHPSIMPTGNTQKLDDQDKKIYELIVRRFISCFCDDAELENKKVELIIDKLKFVAKGMEILKKGWIDVYKVKMEEKEIKDINGEVTISKVRFEEKETKPPKRYSPASILSELEKRNLGTKATRANILETLYNRDYIKDKQIKATELGIRLIDSLSKHSPIIIDENLTKEIERDMDNIRNSKKELEVKEEKVIDKARVALTKISEDFKKQEHEIGKELVRANQALWDQQYEDNRLDVKCPTCKEGELMIKYTPRFKSYFVACDKYPKCKQTFSLPKALIKNNINKQCEDCGWRLLMSIKKGRRPWIFCFNPNCPGKEPLDLDGNIKKKEVPGYKTDVNRKPIERIERVEGV